MAEALTLTVRTATLGARWLAAFALTFGGTLGALAGEPEVVAVEAAATGGTWRFDVTVRHADTGWDHYADAWRVVGPDGTVYGTRTLAHPHVNEQPFTRSLSGVQIPEGIETVVIEAHDSVHGWGSASAAISLPR